MGSQIEAALAELELSVTWDAPEISADVVILHNPLFLKQDGVFTPRIVARHLVVVTHENLLRPNGNEGFDVAHCLGLIDRASLALRKSLAPISGHNRATVESWLKARPPSGWTVLGEDWFNICRFALIAPTETPADRRGRHSRPGFEKFPRLAEMEMCFPPHAVSNVILGADHYLHDRQPHPHWQMLPYRSMPVPDFLRLIDFMVYFTSPCWCESFGRVIAEAIAAGKVVISDIGTARTFGNGVIAARPQEVDEIIAGFVAVPDRYRDHVVRAQAGLAAFSAARFRQMFNRMAPAGAGPAA